MRPRDGDLSLAGVINRAVSLGLAKFRNARVGIVRRYDAAKQQVDVQPAINEPYQAEDGSVKFDALPVIPNVPVLFLGSGGFRVTVPVQVDDPVLLIFSDQSLDKWLAGGGEKIDPTFDHKGALTDAFAIPGLLDFAHALASASADHMTVGHDAGHQIHIRQDETRLGTDDEGDLQAVGLADKIMNALNAVSSYVASHTHPVTVGGVTAGMASATGSTSATTDPQPHLTNVGSGSVLAKVS